MVVDNTIYLHEECRFSTSQRYILTYILIIIPYHYKENFRNKEGENEFMSTKSNF